MNGIMIAMLIWAGGATNGGPGAIPGFKSMESCNAAIPHVRLFYDNKRRKAEIMCMALIE